MSLQRFHQAQASSFSGYEVALEEIRGGCKTSHWIWYIFPQIDGLGRSSTAHTYAIHGLEEACTYLRDLLLGARYEEIANAVSDQLTRGRALDDLMGGKLDSLKLVSSLTLFRAAAQSLARKDESFASLILLCDSILRYAASQGHPLCRQTLARMYDPI